MDNDNGTTVRIGKGATVVVALSSTYWTFPNAPNPAVLQPVGDVTTTPAPIGTCVPGGGCGTVTATYKAVGGGQATIGAARTTCGEALRCTGNQGSYSVLVVVTAS